LHSIFIIAGKSLSEPENTGSGGKYASVEWKIQNNLNGMKLSGSGLAVHLIRDHHFFEGLDSLYRVGPEDYIRLLEVEGV